MSGEAVKVAVRVRPFNSREKERNAKLIVEMAGPQTSLIDPENT
ncbi:Kinesin-like protein KIF1B, partial [Trichoplax sp. H2]